MTRAEKILITKIHKAVHSAAKTIGIFHPAKPDLEKALGHIMELQTGAKK